MENQKLIEEYKQAKEQGKSLPFLTDEDVIAQHHQFLRESDVAPAEAQQAVELYDSLFKELCLADLSAYRQGRVGLRWRTQEEVIAGKGDNSCANLTCSRTDALKSLELNFAYVETGERKNALVQVRLCRKCRHRLRHARRISQSSNELFYL